MRERMMYMLPGLDVYRGEKERSQRSPVCMLRLESIMTDDHDTGL